MNINKWIKYDILYKEQNEQLKTYFYIYFLYWLKKLTCY